MFWALVQVVGALLEGQVVQAEQAWLFAQQQEQPEDCAMTLSDPLKGRGYT